MSFVIISRAMLDMQSNPKQQSKNGKRERKECTLLIVQMSPVWDLGEDQTREPPFQKTNIPS